MSLHGELTGAAARRRERRLRSWLRHERQTVAMVLAEACHHSLWFFPAVAQGEEGGRPRRVRRPTGTEDGQDSWVAPRRARGAGGAGEARGAFAPGASWWCSFAVTAATRGW